jgi:hypothetical protein
MNDLVSYLLAQARRHPLDTARFAAGEALRRRRLRSADGLNAALPGFLIPELLEKLHVFLPENCAAAGDNLPGRASEGSTVCAAAERVCRHEIDIFGERVVLDAQLDWHRDWVSGHRWPVAPPAQLKIVDAAAGADIKRPWELARFHHFLPLGMAWLHTEDAGYAEKFGAQVRHWIKENPFPRGIHWAMPMEAAIRAVNWVTAAACFSTAESLNAKFWEEFFRSLFVHGRFVFSHREWNPVARGNHYLACVVGLLYLGALFVGHPEGEKWLAFARRELLREMRAQVGSDGVAHEGSSGYHAFLTELFLTGALLLARLGAQHGQSVTPAAAIEKTCGHAFVQRLEKMFEFLAALTSGREMPPLWGDSDDGRLLPFCNAPAGAASHLLAVGAAVFQRKDWTQTHLCIEPQWRLGMLPPAVSSSGSSKPAAFRKAGFFFFASSRWQGSIRCGPLGVNGWANHAHCDQLSVEFCFDGQPVLVDPGTYLYSGDAAARNLFRSTRYHNTVTVAGAEQNRFWPGLLFRMMDDTRSRPRKWLAGPQEVEFIGEHYGYRRLRQRVRVGRGVRLNRKSNALEIFDCLTGSGSAHLEWNFHFAPGITLEQEPHVAAQSNPQIEPWGAAVMVKGRTPPMESRIAWRIGPLRFSVATGGKIEKFESRVEPGWVSPQYGRRVEAPVLTLRCTARFPVMLEVTFAPL